MEIHQADKEYRRRSIWTLLGVLALMGVLLWQLNTWLQGLDGRLSGADPATTKQWLKALLAMLGFALALPAAALGASLYRLGRASRLQGRFPPREFKTWRDVRVLRDGPALRWARRVELSSTAAFALAGLLGGWALWVLWYFR
ncbi:hypothetical protein [Aerolutibacter ruishenii]|uniref:Uncharacterized protein n=1 Tax=Aerolutibacter ruishenii TaxID=686800 RepID=A0A562LVD0_9GAMM|nr:hypothetical protein [Lysobacter ruishenii]TWI11590.1 hypothetical protein IP93_01491 [Lysobacter ruishenii]